MHLRLHYILLALPALFATHAHADDSARLPTVTITGTSTQSPGMLVDGGGGADGGYLNGGLCGSGGGGRGTYATGNGASGACSEGSSGNNDRPPKTPKQIENEKKRCDGSYNRDTNALTAETNAKYTACANSATSAVGIVIDRVVGQSSAQTCISAVSDLNKKKQWDIDLAKAECYVAAERS